MFIKRQVIRRILATSSINNIIGFLAVKLGLYSQQGHAINE